MNTWDIAKLLVESCSSPKEVDQVIETLHDPDAVLEVRSLLAVFSTSKTFVLPNAKASTFQRSGSYGSSTRIDRRATRKSGGNSPHRTKDATIRQLESLFRASGMTNHQVEQWITDNFNLRATVGKGSLSRYLTNVLNKANLSLTNRILAAAQRLKDDGATSTSDIKNYWDGLDKHFSPVE